jgi:hypothetical protein
MKVQRGKLFKIFEVDNTISPASDTPRPGILSDTRDMHLSELITRPFAGIVNLVT